jgi:hypothetical protein
LDINEFNIQKRRERRRKLLYRLYKLSAYAMIRAFEQLRGTPFNENRKSHKGYWLRRGNEIAISLYIHTFILPY